MRTALGVAGRHVRAAAGRPSSASIQSDAGPAIEVARDGDRLVAAPPGIAKVELFPLSETRFFSKSPESDVTFQLENGRAVRFPGGYDRYVVEREARLERMAAAYERQQEHIGKTEDFIRRNRSPPVRMITA